MEAFQTGEDFSTWSTTNLFQRVEDLGGNKYYQDEQPTSSTIESPHLKKDVFNSEPLSTKEDNKGTLLWLVKEKFYQNKPIFDTLPLKRTNKRNFQILLFFYIK